jgi:hypothetical protein
MAIQYGAYVQLLDAARADSDPERRQAAHDHIATIAPMAGAIGADGSCPGDALAAPILAQLYPDHAPREP